MAHVDVNANRDTVAQLLHRMNLRTPVSTDDSLMDYLVDSSDKAASDADAPSLYSRQGGEQSLFDSSSDEPSLTGLSLPSLSAHHSPSGRGGGVLSPSWRVHYSDGDSGHGGSGSSSTTPAPSSGTTPSSDAPRYYHRRATADASSDDGSSADALSGNTGVRGGQVDVGVLLTELQRLTTLTSRQMAEAAELRRQVAQLQQQASAGNAARAELQSVQRHNEALHAEVAALRDVVREVDELRQREATLLARLDLVQAAAGHNEVLSVENAKLVAVRFRFPH